MTSLPDTLVVLATGEVELKGRMPWSSNATFLTEVRCGDVELHAVYKPGRGERPLWDFPPGLYRREVAAWRLSELLGWELVPETLVRHDAPLGQGSLQRFVEADFEQHYFTLYEDPTLHDALRRMCAFDLVANNTDRKSGHVLLTPADRHVWGIDNGLCFSVNTHVRTVIWEFGGEPLPDDIVDGLTSLLDRLPADLGDVLDDHEVAAIGERAEDLLASGAFPMADAHGRAYPWPLV